MRLEEHVRSVMDFPKEGIDFKDITPMFEDPVVFAYTIDQMCEMYSDKKIDRIGAFDARGFLFGPTMAYRMDVPFFPIRKKGKLPYETVSESYGLEYGKDCVELHVDAVKPGDKVLLIDDLLATGGTMKAGCNLVDKLGGEVAGCGFVIEMAGLGGRDKLQDYDVRSLLKYEV